MLLAAIPSPSGKAIEIGPIDLRAYGLAIGVGAAVALWLAQRRWEARGGDPDDISAVAVWAIPAGFVGARLYHVATDYRRFQGRWLEAFAVWEGGLGIPGGILVGVLAGAFAARRRGLSVAALLDVVAPALPVAQAIGRLGNWFNQELFGRPTDLPWGLRIDEAHRPDGLEDVALYHPTFLYEALWNLALAAGLVWVGRRWNAKPGQLFTAYVAGYAAGRFWVEALRIDAASEILGLRVNSWVSGITFIVAVTVLVLRARSQDRPIEPSQPAERDGDDQELFGERAADHLADVGFSPPLPQEDRLWRHPSEYSQEVHDAHRHRQPGWLRRRLR